MVEMIVRTVRSYIARFGALQRNARLFVLSNVLVNVAVGAIGLLYLIFLERLGYTTDFLSVLLVVGIAGAGLGLIPAVPLANRYSARKLLIISDLIGGVAAGAQLLIPTPPVLLVTTFFVGATASIFIVLTPPLLTATSSPVERAHLFSLNSSLGFLTGVLGALLGGFLPLAVTRVGLLHAPFIRAFHRWLVPPHALDLQLALLIAGLLALPSLWPLFLMDDAVVGADASRSPTRESPLSGHTVGSTRTTGMPLRRAWAALRAYGWQRARDDLGRLRRWRGLRYMVYQALLGLGAGLFLTYLNPYFANHLKMSTATIGIVASIGTILLAGTSLLAPLLGARLGEVRGAIVTQMGSVPLLAVLAFATNVPLAIGVYLLRTVLMNTGQPLLQSFIMGMLPPGERSAASSAFNVNWQVALAIGGVTSGLIIAHLGYQPTFLIAAACYLAAMLTLVPWFGREAEMQASHHVPEVREVVG